MGWFAAREHIRRDALTDGSGVDFRMTLQKFQSPHFPDITLTAFFLLAYFFIYKDPERNLEKIKRTVTLCSKCSVFLNELRLKITGRHTHTHHYQIEGKLVLGRDEREN